MGAFEEAKGRVKKAAGDLTGNQGLQRRAPGRWRREPNSVRKLKREPKLMPSATRAAALEREQQNTQRPD